MKLQEISVRDLDVKEKEKLVLNTRSQKLNSSLHYVDLKSLDDVKKVLGVSDEYWSQEHPRFGRFASIKSLDEQLQELNVEARAALHEYIYGNSRSVSKWKGALNSWVVNEQISFPVFLFNNVTVGPNATLEIGPAGLSCDILRVHATGKVRVVGSGPTKIETGTYERFY